MAMPLLLPFFFQGLNARWDGEKGRKRWMGLWFEKILILFGCMEEMGKGSCVKEKEKGRKEGREEELRGK